MRTWQYQGRTNNLNQREPPLSWNVICIFHRPGTSPHAGNYSSLNNIWQPMLYAKKHFGLQHLHDLMPRNQPFLQDIHQKLHFKGNVWLLALLSLKIQSWTKTTSQKLSEKIRLLQNREKPQPLNTQSSSEFPLNSLSGSAFSSPAMIGSLARGLEWSIFNMDRLIIFQLHCILGPFTSMLNQPPVLLLHKYSKLGCSSNVCIYEHE